MDPRNTHLDSINGNQGGDWRQRRSLKIRPHPAGVQGVSMALALGQAPVKFLQVLEAQAGPASAADPSQN